MEDILKDVVKAVLVASASAIAPLVVALLVQVLRRVNVELSQAQEAKVQSQVHDVLLEVEEWASHRIKAQIPVTAGMKLGRAIERLLDKIPGIDEAEAEMLVRQELPKLGLGAVAFLQAAAAAVTNDQK